MFDKKSEYTLNKYNQDSIIYISVSGRIRLTRADFPSEEEFLKWKTWSDADYHETEKKGRSFNDNRVYSQNYYRIVKEKNRTYYEVYSLPGQRHHQKVTPRFPSSACGPMELMKPLQRSAVCADTPERRSGIWMIFTSIC